MTVGSDVPTATRRDHARVESGQVEASGETSVLDLEAPVLDHTQARLHRSGSGVVVAEAELEPHHLPSGCDRLLHDLRQLFGPSKATDDVGWLRQVSEAGVAAHPQHLVV